MAYLDRTPPIPASERAPEEYWQEVAALGIHDLVPMADCPDYVGQTPDGAYIRVPNPPRAEGEALMQALIALTARCEKWLH